MITLWRALSGLCVAALALGLAVGPAVAPAHAQTCTELLINGGFETDAGWQLGVSPVMPQYVTYAKHSGNRSLVLGITSGANIQSFSSARQTVTIPAAGQQALLSFWFYAMADAPATTDYMELVLLDTSDAILSKPWRSHNDSRVWNQMTFDLTPWRGQTVQIYFNVYNDGVGGRAAMFLDDVSLVSCTGVATGTPTGTPTGTAVTTPTVGPATATPSPSPSPSPTPGCVDVLVDGRFDNGLAFWQVFGDSAGIAPVTAPVRSAPFALKLGSLEQPLNSLNTARQLVTLPAGYPQVTLEAWVYTQTQAGAGADYQQMALLDSSGGLLYLPWQRLENNPAWQPLTFDISAFTGQTVFVSFSVNNDGIGGRTAMHVDDVRVRACAPGVTLSPTPTGTPPPTGTPSPTPTPSPTGTPATPAPLTPTLTSPPPGCDNLLQNSGFETGYHPWRPGSTSLPPQIVASPVFSGAYAIQLGTQVNNHNAYSSIRQTVTVPWNRPRVVISFWVYTWAETLTGADRQQFILMAPDGQVLVVPWSVLANTQAWEQRVFDVIGVAGQTFDLYFNVINDGLGGRTALFVDEVYAWACTTGAYPPALASPTPATTPPAGSPTPLGMTPVAVLQAHEAGIRPAANATTVSILTLPPPALVSQATEEVTRLPEMTPTALPTTAPTLPERLLSSVSNLSSQGPRGWPVLIVLIVLLMLLLVVIRWRQNP